MELFDRIKKTAQETPDKLAIVDRDGQRAISYSKLLSGIYGVSKKLSELGLVKGDAVMINMGRCAEYVIAELGIIYSGLTAVPVLPEYPKDRVDYIKEESNVKLVVTGVFFSDIKDGVAAVKENVQDDDVSLIIFTSGSTGRPKGIVYTSAVLDYPIRNNNSSSKMVKDIRFAAMAPMSFVASLGEYFNVLSLGGCSHIISEEVRSDIKKIEAYYAEHKITTGFLPPRMLAVYKNSDTDLVMINTGSEAVRDFAPVGFKVVNNYGQSETCGSVCSFIIDKPYETTPIGKPKKGVEVKLLDENGKEVKDGEDGEICVIGVFPSRYLNMPEQSAKTFTVLDDGKVMVHTGDIGRMLPDGNLLYINRRDWMVKINGQRVDLGEVEGAIKRVKGVKDAAVKDFKYANGQIYLCAYYTGAATEKEIKDGITKELAPYMIPTFFVKMEKLPTNINGKLDKTALKAPDISAFKEKYVAPKTEAEKLLCAAFEELLKCGKVGVNDNFFLLGGDSIKAMQLQNIIDSPALTSDIIFNGKTPKKIAAEMTKPGADVMGDAIKEEREAYPFTPSQLGVYFECVQNPQGTMYNNPFAFAIKKKSGIDINKLVAAVEKAISNHGALNMRIDASSGDPMMKPCPTKPVIERAKVSGDELEAAKARFVKPFDITGGALYRACILESEDSYTLCMDLHHLVFDGTSLSVLLGEIRAAYDGEQLPPERVSQLKLGIYEQLVEKTPAYEAAKNYFASTLGGVDTRAEFVTDGAEATGEDKPCEKLVYTVSDELSSERVESVSAMLGVTPNTLFLGAFQYAIAKFTCSDDVVVCAANHGRHDSRMSNTVGMMVRTIPLYAHIDDESDISAYLTAVQNGQRETIAHDVYPFFKISGEYGINTDIMFAYQSDAFNTITIGGETMPLEELTVGSAITKIELMIFKAGSGYTLNMKYRSDLYSRENIKSFCDMYVNVLSEFTKKKKLCDVRLVDEKQVMTLDSFTQTRREYDRTKSVVDLFRDSVKASPDAVAVVYLDRKYTYRQVDEISDRIARYIEAKGIGREDVVSVLIPRCEYMALASLGVLKAGAGYQPLDPSYPPERLQFMMEDSSAKLLIADRSLLPLVPAYKGDVLLIEDIPALPAGKPKTKGPKPEDLFIMLYTSGTTGKPKGVMLEHCNLVAFCNYYSRLLSLDSSSRVAAYASYGFDACMMDMYPVLSVGGTLYIVDESIRLDLAALNDYFKENKITNSFITTQVGRLFAQTTDSPYLKSLAVGGEKLVPLDPPQGFKLYNVYGPTETTIFINEFVVDKLYERVPVGKAVDNTALYVLDKYNRRLPVGALGELCVTGYQVGRGYLNRPEQKAFCANPFSSEPGYTRMYHTGDIVRFMPDGKVDIIGRRDGQVKIRGFRIELGEVERVIREYPGITDATVVAKDDAGGGKCIVAYIVSDGKVDIAGLNAFIAENKPPYMVPAATMQIDKIPLNVNGKVDWRKLPDIKIEAEEESARPNNALEQKLCDIAAKIIGNSDFGVTSVLQRYGLTSLSVIKLAVEIKKEFGYEADVKALMKECSILALENALLEYYMSGSHSPVKAEVRQYKQTYPLSSAQFGVYADVMRDPQTTKYNIPCMLRFDPAVSADDVTAAVKKVVAAHPYMFTYITLDGEDVAQVYTSGGDVDIPVVDVSEAELKKLKGTFVRPFNLMKAPLFRFEIARTKKNVCLLCDFHHIILDGGSVDLFMKQLKTALEGGNIEAEDYNYFDYVDAEKADLGGEKFKAVEKHFETMLAECEAASEITPDLSGRGDGELAEVILPTDLEKCEKFCSGLGITPAHLYLAGTAYAVSRFTNSRNVFINTISNGRSDLKLSDCFGMFVKTLPIGIAVDDITCGEFIKRAGKTFVDTIQNELYPYSTVCTKYNYAPNIMYEYQIGVVEKLTVSGKDVVTEGLALSGAKFKVAVHIEMRGGKPSVVVQYNDALYSEGLMRTLAESINAAIQNMISAPDGKVRKISMLTAKQDKKVKAFAASAGGEIDIKLLHKMFERQVDKTPDDLAIIAADGKLTYAELDRRANAVANALIKAGFKPHDKAVVLLERTSNIFAAEFGILKAGGVFIPTSPEYPEDRINSIISDSGAKLVLCAGETLKKYKKTVDINELIAKGDGKRPDIKVAPEDLAYMIYTSGSTGKPKGVMLRHIGICNYLTDSPVNPQVHDIVSKCRRYGSVTTVAFDMNLKETILSLVHGLTLVFADDDMTLDPFKLAKFFNENHIDAFNATPSRLLEYMTVDDFAKAMAGCKVILSGGEGYPQVLLDLLREKTNAEIINTYGPTEITVSSNCAVLTDAKYISVGKPLYNYIEYIVDADDNILPVGVVGELIICGVGVGNGYNALPEKTAEAFVTFNGQRAYRSGDYAKWTDDGNVVILGRKDNQVKIRGLRIELGEIEKCMTEIKEVKRAVIVIRKLGKEDAICAYYTADKELDSAYIKGEIGKKLTEYMIPASITYMETMPLTPNGKVNVKALPVPQAEVRAEGKAAASAMEQTFCDIFAKVLDLDSVYADDSFFNIGGTSLTVTRVIIAASKAGINIAYGDVFAHPTPQELAKFLEGNVQNSTDSESFGNYDYTAIDGVLAKNDINAFKKGDMQPLGNVLLTGATGFLGIHMLHELLQSTTGKIYCLARGNRRQTATVRLDGMYFYYFEEVLTRDHADRVQIIDGDITDKAVYPSLEKLDFDTVINCAAIVKHFSQGTEIEDVNYYGTLNIIELCKKTGKRLVHVSTMSVGGAYIGQRGKYADLTENLLYFGQSLDSKYTRSKFMAERAILQAASEGLGVKIMRVGTLAPRDSDGEYQINFATNNFMRRLKSVYLIGKYPYEMIELPFELSPIDSVAKAIVLLATTPKDCVVFHPYNNNMLLMGNLYEEMNRLGLSCKAVDYSEYSVALDEAKNDPQKVQALSGFIAYENSAHGQKVFQVGKSNAFTMQVLYRLGFRWPVTSEEYMRRFIAALNALGFFDMQ